MCGVRESSAPSCAESRRIAAAAAAAARAWNCLSMARACSVDVMFSNDALMKPWRLDSSSWMLALNSR